MSIVIMFNGEQYWLEDVFYICKPYETKGPDLPKILYELIKVEGAYIKGKTSRKLIDKKSFSPLTSSMDFRDSEWSMGVTNGQAK